MIQILPTGAANFQRRHVLELGAAVLGLAFTRPRVQAAAGLPPDLVFDIYRKGSRIGANEVRFRPEEGGFTVTTVMDLAVKLAFITVYSYRQEARERWREGRLVASDIVTDDAGKVTHVEVRPSGAELAVEGPRGAYRVLAGTMTDLGFWNPAIIEATQLVDGQYGELMPLRLIAGVEETIAVAGQPTPTTRYGFVVSQSREGTAREGTNWYDRSGRWVRCELRTRGELLTLELKA